MASIGPHAMDQLERSAKTLLLPQLKTICKAETMPTNFVKATLLNSVLARARIYQSSNNIPGFMRLKAMIENPHGNQPYYSNSNSPQAASTPSRPAYNHASAPPRFIFKESPYYSPIVQIGNVAQMDAMPHNRYTVEVKFIPNHIHQLDPVPNDPNLRVMVFCSMDSATMPHQDIAFPHQCELKVNGNEVRANMKGLKKQPGSTRPVDITSYLHFKPRTQQSIVSMTYALNDKASQKSQKFFLSVWLVRIVPVADLVDVLAKGQRISKAAVLREMARLASDPDIETTSSVLSLKCPISTLRIDLPSRGIACRHNQCFDATSYLQLQEQGPTWQCPICNNSATFKDLAVDEYMKDILANTAKSVDQVTVEPDGRWSTGMKIENKTRNSASVAFSLDDDDFVEVTKDGNRTTTATALPLSNGNGVSTSPRTPEVPRRQSSKRPAAQVVDLTLSDDDEPPRPAQKPRLTTKVSEGFQQGIPPGIPSANSNYISYTDNQLSQASNGSFGVLNGRPTPNGTNSLPSRPNFSTFGPADLAAPDRLNGGSNGSNDPYGDSGRYD